MDTEKTELSSRSFDFVPVETELVKDTGALGQLLGSSVFLVTVNSPVSQTLLNFIHNQRCNNLKNLITTESHPAVGHGLLIHDVSRSHTTTHRSR